MLQSRVNQARYVGVPICSDESVNSMIRFSGIDKINMSEFYLNCRSKKEKSSSIELTRVQSNS